MDSEALDEKLRLWDESISYNTDDIAKLQKQQKSLALMVLIVGLGTGIAMVGAGMSMKAIRDLSGAMRTNLEQIGEAFEKLSANPQPRPQPVDNVSQSSPSAPAEGPASSTPGWAQEAMAQEPTVVEPEVEL